MTLVEPRSDAAAVGRICFGGRCHGDDLVLTGMNVQPEKKSEGKLIEKKNKHKQTNKTSHNKKISSYTGSVTKR